MSQWGNYPLTEEYKQKVLNANKLRDMASIAPKNRKIQAGDNKITAIHKTQVNVNHFTELAALQKQYANETNFIQKQTILSKIQKVKAKIDGR